MFTLRDTSPKIFISINYALLITIRQNSFKISSIHFHHTFKYPFYYSYATLIINKRIKLLITCNT